MADQLAAQIVDVVQESLRTSTSDTSLVVESTDSMETVNGWDSLSFMNVFLTVNETFGLNPDFDDAIHYTAVASIIDYVREQVA